MKSLSLFLREKAAVRYCVITAKKPQKWQITKIKNCTVLFLYCQSLLMLNFVQYYLNYTTLNPMAKQFLKAQPGR